MKTIFNLAAVLLALLPFATQAQNYPTLKNCKRCVVLAEQSVDRVAIADLDKQAIIWDWRPDGSIKPEHRKWFQYPSDAKPVCGGRYILTTASGGAVTLIRVADKKVVFYAFAGGNTHSAELLPDGNIVAASSDGNCLTVFHTDTLHFPDGVYKKQVSIPFGHNAVWDKERKVLWSAGMNKLKTFSYNFNCTKPDLALRDSIDLPGTEAHDLFPVYGQQTLWLTNTTGVYQYKIGQHQLVPVTVAKQGIKSITSKPGDVDLMTYPDENIKGWWTEKVISADGKVIFKQAGLKIYKARWFVENPFSYLPGADLKLCK